MPPLSNYHNHSQFGFRIDDAGRIVYGHPGVGGCTANAPLRFTNCGGCGKEFGTYYATQAYCDDNCRGKAARERRKQARARMGEEQAFVPLPTMSLAEMQERIESKKLAAKIVSRPTGLMGQTLEETSEQALHKLGYGQGRSQRTGEADSERG